MRMEGDESARTDLAGFAVDDECPIVHFFQLRVSVLTKGENHLDRRRIVIFETELAANVIIESRSIVLSFVLHASEKHKTVPVGSSVFFHDLTNYRYRTYLHASRIEI